MKEYKLSISKSETYKRCLIYFIISLFSIYAYDPLQSNFSMFDKYILFSFLIYLIAVSFINRLLKPYINIERNYISINSNYIPLKTKRIKVTKIAIEDKKIFTEIVINDSFNRKIIKIEKNQDLNKILKELNYIRD